jgi:hypothetical protein
MMLSTASQSKNQFAQGPFLAPVFLRSLGPLTPFGEIGFVLQDPLKVPAVTGLPEAPALPFGLFWLFEPLTLAQPHASTTAVFIDELDAIRTPTSQQEAHADILTNFTFASAAGRN